MLKNKSTMSRSEKRRLEFMLKSREMIIDKCEGCDHIDTDKKCEVYINPSSWWDRGGCPMATHLTKRDTKRGRKINPLKASKRRNR
jgi:hypothetical protein